MTVDFNTPRPGLVYATAKSRCSVPETPCASSSASRSAIIGCPIYLRGKTGVVEAVIEPPRVDNEEEGLRPQRRHRKRHYYRIAVPMTEIWPGYAGSPRDGLRIEVFETWLERI